MNSLRLYTYFLLAIFCSFVFAQNGFSAPAKNASSTKNLRYFPVDVLSNAVVISKDDDIYRRTRKEIQASFLKSDHKKIIDKYRSEYFNSIKSNSPKLLPYGFGWLYSAYYREYVERKHPTKELVEAFTYVTKENIPPVYDYVRLRFILRQVTSSDKSLRPLGERLLSISPSDIEVKYQLAKLIDPSHSLNDRQRAIQLSEEMIKDAPNRASVWSRYGSTYYVLWLMTRSKSYAQKSIFGYRKYLSLSDGSSSPALIERVKDFIKEMSGSN